MILVALGGLCMLIGLGAGVLHVHFGLFSGFTPALWFGGGILLMILNGAGSGTCYYYCAREWCQQYLGTSRPKACPRCGSNRYTIKRGDGGQQA